MDAGCGHGQTLWLAVEGAFIWDTVEGSSLTTCFRLLFEFPFLSLHSSAPALPLGAKLRGS